ncbi:MAG TPA: 3-dehydroquinate synthase [Candidatus Dormibacteraeota bacterium]|nr:3-dehydroquinate synthase [Candidatus Dormibacteraeota bacterium]
MKKSKRISVTSAAGKYAILCGPRVLGAAVHEISRLGKFSSVHIVSAPKVWRAAGKLLPARFDSSGAATIHLFQDAERAKTLPSVEQIARSLSRAGADRHAVLVAVGGGMVGDVAGFAAATYLRGISLVHVPTTLLAQVDSAIGGKTGVNLPEGKNLVGAFYSPRLVLSDPETLRTLPDREFRGGIAEVIKYGVISDAKLFAFLEANMERVVRRDPAALAYVIPRCAEIKARVVSKDEHESGLREILNFGHTFGHALESVTKYRVFQHGEAVAWGMMAAALLGYVAGITPEHDATRIISLVRRMGALPGWPKTSVDKLVSAMRSDKKTRGGKIRFVLTPGIGSAKSYDHVSLKLVEAVLRFGPSLLTGLPE